MYTRCRLGIVQHYDIDNVNDVNRIEGTLQMLIQYDINTMLTRCWPTMRCRQY